MALPDDLKHELNSIIFKNVDKSLFLPGTIKELGTFNMSRDNAYLVRDSMPNDKFDGVRTLEQIAIEIQIANAYNKESVGKFSTEYLKILDEALILQKQAQKKFDQAYDSYTKAKKALKVAKQEKDKTDAIVKEYNIKA